ncbi:MAG: FkbM family methyltransferase [Chthoniobacterales bacterium]
MKHALTPDKNQFLRECRAVIHIGANDGGERNLYARHGLTVLWVEALPDVFQTLKNNLDGYPKQRAIRALVTDKDGETYEFHISNNSGESSSIYEFGDHEQLWPDVTFIKTIRLSSTTLPTLLRDAGSSPVDFDALILDVQGAELLVIQGAGQVLDSLRFIKAEASDFESYRGACTVTTLSQALKERGFSIRHKECFAAKPGVGSYYDILYTRSA